MSVNTCSFLKSDEYINYVFACDTHKSYQLSLWLASHPEYTEYANQAKVIMTTDSDHFSDCDISDLKNRIFQTIKNKE